MIGIDYSSTAIAAITGGFKDDLNESEEEIGKLVLHVIISTMKSLKKKFKADYGSEVVIACDSSHYWRKDFYEHYKAGRKKFRDDSSINWEVVHKYMLQAKIALKENFPYKVIDVHGAEADDVLAVLANQISANKIVQNGMFDEPEPCLIIGTDKDYKQLINNRVRMFNPREKKFVSLDVSAKEFLKRQILNGDKSDYIPNVFSPIDSFVVGKRQVACTEKRMLPFLLSENMSEATDDVIIKNRIIQNQTLIDMSFIPEHIKNSIVHEYENVQVGNRMKVFKWLAANDMRLMMRDVDEF